MSKKVNVYGLDGSKKYELELPPVFETKPRLDIIHRVVVAFEANEKQPQGRDPLAGQKVSGEYYGAGFHVARVPRQKGSGFSGARGGVFAPNAVGGRLTHPPRSWKNTKKTVNLKEKHLALLSAISATGIAEMVKKRGHQMKDVTEFPLVVEDKIENLNKTRFVMEAFEKLGIVADVERCKDRKNVRAGKGKRRGRRYKHAKGPLIVVKDNSGINKAARNIEGVDVITVKNLNTRHLAPGALAGRLTVWSASAIKELSQMTKKEA